MIFTNRQIVSDAGTPPKRGGIAIPSLTVFLFLTLCGSATKALSDPPPICNASTSFIDGSNPAGFAGLGWDVNVTCVSTDPTVVIEQITVGFIVTRVGGGFQQSFSGSAAFLATSYAERFLPGMGCLPPGDYTWIMGYGCAYWGPIDHESSVGGPVITGGGWPPEFSGTFSIAPTDSAVTLTAAAVDPPTAQGNMKITYAFGKNSLRPAIHIDAVYDESVQVTQFKDERIINLTPGQHVIYATSCYYNNVVGVKTFNVPSPASDYTAVGQILDGSAAESKVGVKPGVPFYAQVPLGLELRLGIQKKGAYIPAKFVLAPATLAGVASPTLYPTNAVLGYGRNVHEAQKTFRGVHIGTQVLTVTPDDSGIPPFVVTLGVFDPGALGNADVQYDPQIVSWGNQRGIPPHLLKGLIKKETGKFDPFTYRYEPLNKDTGDLGISVTLDELQDEPYEHYRMATAGGLAKGDSLLDLNSGAAYTTVDDDVSARRVLKRQSGAALTPLDVCPVSCVSAKELLLANDARQHWAQYAPWFDMNDPGDLASMNFTAQTPLAASYGLMQTMYQVAAELQWQTTDGRRNPSLLFDTLPNALIGGGSLAIGTLEFYKRYRASRRGDSVTDPDFDNSAAYRSMIVDALNYYNHGSKRINVTYGDDAWNFSQQYVPAHPLSKVFP